MLTPGMSKGVLAALGPEGNRMTAAETSEAAGQSPSEHSAYVTAADPLARGLIGGGGGDLTQGNA